MRGRSGRTEGRTEGRKEGRKEGRMGGRVEVGGKEDLTHCCWGASGWP